MKYGKSIQEWKNRMMHFDSEIKHHVTEEHRREINNEDIPHWNRRSINQNDKDFTHLLFRNVVKNEFNNETDSDSNKDEYTNIMDIGLYPRGNITNWNGPLLRKGL